MGKMSEIDYEIRSGSRLVHDLRCYPEHYEAAHQAADRIKELEAALRYVDANMVGNDHGHWEMLPDFRYDVIQAALVEK